jgi:RHS repeat-associated protein
MMIRRSAFVIVISVLVVSGWHRVNPVDARQQPQSPPATSDLLSGTGETRTPLGGGRWLVAGGSSAGGVTGSLSLFDASTNTTVVIPRRLRDSRAWHTATVLADGSVLIFGGRGERGRILASAERFDPGTETLAPVEIPGADARVGHSATLLTDGRVLIAGGQTDNGQFVVADEIWNLEAGTILKSVGGQPRSGHSATLLGDGRVLLAGGSEPGGRRSDSAEIFDPRSNTVTPAAMPFVADSSGPWITELRPPNGATDVPVDTNVTLRFSEPISDETVSEQTVVLSGPDGPVSTRIVNAENGRLMFVWPRDPLASATSYQLTFTAVRDRAGRPLIATPSTFSTAAAKSTDAPDTESWVPNAPRDGWQTHRPPSPWQSLPALHAEPGVTAVAGQVLTLDGRPLRNVTLAMDGTTTRSDATGRFLLALSTMISARRELGIDGRTASRPGRQYGVFEYGLTVTAGTTTVLPFTIWMPRLDLAHQITIPSPTTAETVITTPLIPGLELHLPPQTTIRGEDGEVITQIGITPIPVDRPPFPLATNVVVPVYFTVQPGGAYVYTSGGGQKGAWLVYPNYQSSAPGQRIQFYHYDPDEKDWYVYGLGTVTANGAQVSPDPTTRLYEFTGAMINSGNSPPASSPTTAARRVADPVDPSTGLFVMQKTDLYLPDVIPIAMTRVYNSGDSLARPFGRGMTHPYAMFLWSAHQYTEVDLILPDGGKLHYVRTSAGTSFPDAVFVHQESATTAASPTPFYKSFIVWNERGWSLTLRNGTVYVFGENAPLQSIRDRYGNTVTISHETGQYGNVTRVTSPNGRWISFTYGTGGRITQVTDNTGRTARYTYDVNGNLSTAIDPNGGVTTYTWTATNQIATIKDARDIVYLTNTYQNGRVATQTLADSNATFRFAYTLDASGAVIQTDVTDPRGHANRLTFNDDHYLVTDTQALGLPEERTFTIERVPGSNFVAAHIDALNRRTEYTYDAYGHVMSITRLAGTPQAAVTALTYEPRYSQLSSVTDPLGHVSSASYDLAGRLTAISDATGRRAAVIMNAAGQITSVSDAAQNPWRFAYSGGDLTAVTDPTTAVYNLITDSAGRIVSATDSAGQTTRLAWDVLNRLTTLTDPLGAQTAVAYDGNANVLGLTDALNQTTTYTYDAFDRVATRSDPLLHTETRVYDGNGNLTALTDRRGQTRAYQYDGLDRLRQVTYADGSTVSYQRDLGDRVTRIDDSLNGSIVRQYDLFDRVVQETTLEGTVSYTYDADGRRSTMTVEGQPAVSYEYDDAHRLTAVRQAGTAVILGYDGAGRRTSITLPNGVVASYQYDVASRLTELRYSLDGTILGNLTYGYDVSGSRTSVGGSWARTALPRPLAAATYDAANRLETWGPTSFDYDLNGNTVSDGANLFAWNARNQLTAIDGAAAATFRYDAMGRRRSKTVGPTTTRFLYDGANSVQEQSSGGVPIANILTALGVDETLLRSDSSGPRVLLTDALGSTVAMADEAGRVQTQYTYEPFGATIVSGETSTNAAAFTGREDDGTGLYFYRARYYDPARGRFAKEDPIGFAGGVNLYAYTLNNPINSTDPSGQFACTWHRSITLGAAIYVGYPGDLERLGWQICGVDDEPDASSPSPEFTHRHSMAGRKRGNQFERCDAAYEGTRALLGDLIRTADVAHILHILQDQWAAGHRFMPWGGFSNWPQGTSPGGHLMGDLFPSNDALVGASMVTRRFLFDFMNGHVGNPGDYLMNFCG